MLDGDAGADELVYRRVGANELGAIGVMQGYVDAQNEYAATGHDGDPAGIYALKLVSDPGLENGLYWETAEREAASPAGAFVAAAAAEGYRSGAAGGPTYHGYRYRMLYRQGTHANGGARDYFSNGMLSDGFGMIAWPADYAASGVMTCRERTHARFAEIKMGVDRADCRGTHRSVRVRGIQDCTGHGAQAGHAVRARDLPA
ncbi:MAG: DUF2950 family protein [Pseudomonadota bacterium]